MVGSSCNKQRELTRESCLGQESDEDPPTHQTVKGYKEVVSGSSHVGQTGVLSTTLLSQGCVLAAASGSRKGKLNLHSEDRGGGKEPPNALGQLIGQAVGTFFDDVPTLSSSWPYGAEVRRSVYFRCLGPGMATCPSPYVLSMAEECCGWGV